MNFNLNLSTCYTIYSYNTHFGAISSQKFITQIDQISSTLVHSEDKKQAAIVSDKQPYLTSIC